MSDSDSSSASSRRSHHGDDGSSHSGSHSGSDSSQSRKKSRAAPGGEDDDSSDSASEGSGAFISDSDTEADERSTSSRQEEEDNMSQRSASEKSKGSSLDGSGRSGGSGSEHSESSKRSAGSGSQQLLDDDEDDDDRSEPSGSSRNSDDASEHSRDSSQGGDDTSESRMSGDGSESRTAGDRSGHSAASVASGSQRGDDDDKSRVSAENVSDHSKSSHASASQSNEGSDHSRSTGSAASSSQGDDDGSEHSRSAASDSQTSHQSGDDNSEDSRESAASGSHTSMHSGDDGSKHSAASGSQQDQDTDSQPSGDDGSERSKSSNNGSDESHNKEVSTARSRQSDSSSQNSSSSRASAASSDASEHSSKSDEQSTASVNREDDGSDASKSRGSTLSKSSRGSKSQEDDNSTMSGSQGGNDSSSKESGSKSSAGDTLSAASGNASDNSKKSGSSAQSGSSKTSVSVNDSSGSDERSNKSDQGDSNISTPIGVREASNDLGSAKKYVPSTTQPTTLARGNNGSIPKGEVSSLGKGFAFKEAKPSRFGDPPPVRGHSRFGDPPSVSGYAKSQKSSQQSVKSQTTGNSYASKASWISSQASTEKNTSDRLEKSKLNARSKNRPGIPVTEEMEDKLAQRRQRIESGETADAKKCFPMSKDLEPIMDRRRSPTEVMIVSATAENAPLEHNFTDGQHLSNEESKTEITNEVINVLPIESKEKKYKYKDKGRSNDSRSTALTAESLETATERDRSVARESVGGEAKLEQIAEPVDLGISEEESMSEYEEESVTETEVAEEVDTAIEVKPKKRAASDDFLGEIVAFAESQNALEFSWVPVEHIEIAVDESEQTEEEILEHIVEDENVVAEAKPADFDDDYDTGDELMGRYGSADEYLFSEARTRESHSLVSIPEIVEFGRQDDGVHSAVLSRNDGITRTLRPAKYDDDELPFDESRQDNVQEQVAKDKMEGFPEIKSVYDCEDGDIDGLFEVVTTYKERLQILAEERKELLIRDNAEAKAASADRENAPGAKKPDAVERTKKLLEKLKVATLSRKKGIPLETMETPEGKLKSTEVREQEVLTSVHKVDWSMFRTRKTLESIKAGAEANERDIPPQFEEARDTLSRSQEHFSKLRRTVTTKSTTQPSGNARLRTR